MCGIDCCSAAALAFLRNVSFGLYLYLRFPESFVFVFFGALCVAFVDVVIDIVLVAVFLVVILRVCCNLFFFCCAFWFFFAIDTNCSWLYSSSSPSRIFVVDVLGPCISECCFCLARLFSPKQNCYAFSWLLLYSLRDLHATMCVSLFGGDVCF